MTAPILQNISKIKSNISILFILILVIFLFHINITSANTGINSQIPYSGNIVKNNGTVLDGSYRAKFILYNASSAGTIIYEEIRDGVTNYVGTGVSPLLSVSDGRFEILLGSQNTTINTVNDDSLWLELQLDMDNNGSYEEIFSPRKRIGSALSTINSMRLVANGGVSTNTLSLDSIGNLVFTGDSAIERMRITGTGVITASALGGASNATIPSGFDRLLLANSSGQFSQLSLDSLWSIFGNNTSSVWNGSTGSFLGTTSAQPLVLATTNATAQDIRFFTGVNGANERMRILGTGNVGIGMTAPTTTLDVNGATTLRGNTYVKANGQMYFTNIDTGGSSGGEDLAIFGAYGGPVAIERYRFRRDGTFVVAGDARFGTSVTATSIVSSGASTLRFAESQMTLKSDDTGGGDGLYLTRSYGVTATNAEVLRIRRDTGNVGIGTASPGAALQINGGAAIGYSASTVAPTNGLAISGNLGAGTTTPGAQLTVNLPTQATNTVNSLLMTRFQRPQTSGLKYGNSMDILLGSYGTTVNSETRVDFRLANGSTDLPDTTVMTLQGNGNVGIGTTAPTARLTLVAGTATANTAPLKFTSGTNITTPEAGAVEWNGTNLFLTNSSNIRQTINQGLTATATLDFPSTNNNSFNNLTVTVTGAVDGDVVTLGIPNASVPAAASSFTAWVSAANTVTVRFSNHSGVAQDPASGSFKVFVTKF